MVEQRNWLYLKTFKQFLISYDIIELEIRVKLCQLKFFQPWCLYDEPELNNRVVKHSGSRDQVLTCECES